MRFQKVLFAISFIFVVKDVGGMFNFLKKQPTSRPIQMTVRPPSPQNQSVRNSPTPSLRSTINRPASSRASFESAAQSLNGQNSPQNRLFQNFKVESVANGLKNGAIGVAGAGGGIIVVKSIISLAESKNDNNTTIVQSAIKNSTIESKTEEKHRFKNPIHERSTTVRRSISATTSSTNDNSVLCSFNINVRTPSPPPAYYGTTTTSRTIQQNYGKLIHFQKVELPIFNCLFVCFFLFFSLS